MDTVVDIRSCISAQTDAKGDLAKASVLYPAPARYEVAHTRFVARFTPLVCILCHSAHNWDATGGFPPSF
jgi:hypothetical protein